jgi:hypothetical protein
MRTGNNHLFYLRKGRQIGWNLSRVYLVVRRHEKRRLGALIPQETRVTGLIPETYSELPLPTTMTVFHSNPI